MRRPATLLSAAQCLRDFAEANAAAAACDPAFAEDPRCRGLDGGWLGGRIEGVRPSGEPGAARAGIEEADVDHPVFQMIREDVDEDAPHLARGREIASMVPIAPYAAGASPEDATVDAHRDSNCEAPHPVGEGRGIVGLDDDVDMIGLHRIVRDAKSLAPRVADGPLEELPQPLATEVG